MRSRRNTEGRYVVGDKSSPSLGAAVALCATLAMNGKRTEYVHVIGQQRAVARAEYDGHGVTIHVLDQRP